jgi:lambda family phage tail tape measure protein
VDETKTLAWQLIVETKGIEQNTKAAADSLGSLSAAADLAEASISAVVGSEILRQFVDLINAYEEIGNKLRLVTDGADHLADVQDRLIEQSSKNRSDLASSADLYTKLTQGLEGYGKSANDVLALLSTIEQTIKLSGSNASDAAGEIQHFTNALQAGSLSERDITTLLQKLPDLGKAIAKGLNDGLGVSIATLKEMAKQGELTTGAVTDALTRSAAETQSAFDKLAPTFKESLGNVRDGAISAAGALDDVTGLTKLWSITLNGLADDLNLVGKGMKSLKSGVLDVASSVKTFVVNTVDLAKAAVNGQGALLAYGQATHQTANWMDTATDSTVKLTKAQEEGKAVFNEATAALNAQLGASAIKQAALNAQIAAGAANQRAGADDARHLSTTLSAQLEVETKLAAAKLAGKQVSADEVAQWRALAATGAAVTNALGDQTEKLGLNQQAFEANRSAVQGYEAQITQAAVAQAALTLSQSFGINQQQAGALAAARFTAAIDAQLKVAAQVRDEQQRGITVTAADLAQRQKLAAQAASDTAAENERAAQLAKSNEAALAFQSTMIGVGDALAQTALEQNVLNVEVTQGVDAAAAYRIQAEANLKLEQELNVARAQGKDVTDGRVTAERAATKALADQQATLAQSKTNWSNLNAAIDAGRTPAEQATINVQHLQAAYAEFGASLDASQATAYFQTLRDETAKTSDFFEEKKGVFDAFVTDFTNFLTDGKYNFKAFALSLIQDMGKIIIEMELMKAAKLLLGGFGGGSIGLGDIGLGGMAAGGVINRGNVVPFESGGVVGSPVTFGLAGGRTGLMGEAGPEAVMPLSRLPGGALGVKSAPHRIQVINKLGVPAAAKVTQSSDRTSIVLEAAQLGAQMAEDKLMRSVRSGYGPSATALQRTYSLRRRTG